MRLLDTKTGQFRTVHDPRKERYAIISHTWAQEGEQTYKDMLEIQQCAERRALGAIAHQRVHDMQEDPGAPCEQCRIISSFPHDASSFPSDLLSDPLMPGLPGPIVPLRGTVPARGIMPVRLRKESRPYDGVRSALSTGIAPLAILARALTTPVSMVIHHVVSFVNRGTALVRSSVYALIARVVTYFRRPVPGHTHRNDGIPRRSLQSSISEEIMDSIPSGASALSNEDNSDSSSDLGNWSESDGDSTDSSTLDLGPWPRPTMPIEEDYSDSLSDLVPPPSPHTRLPSPSPRSDEESSDSQPHEIDRHITDILTNAPVFTDPRVSEKTRMACCLAAEIGLELVWMDSCCVDQDSSAELSEAINSMYEWYECSTICLVFLTDVDDDDDPIAPKSQFRESRWHTRGWTLQELIAPRHHIFYSRGWKRLGTKISLARTLTEVTGIERRILNHEASVDLVSVAQRMFWASKRCTTRVEDEAYALMGIFGVHMPTIYGEGRKAFIRLQEEILRHTYDQSIFAWGPCWRHGEVPQEVPTERPWSPGTIMVDAPFMSMYGLLANSPQDFEKSDGIGPLDHGKFVKQLRLNAELLPYPEYILSHDIRTRLPLLPADQHRHSLPEAYRKLMYHKLAILACHDRDGALIVLPLIRSTNVDDYTHLVGAIMEPDVAVYYHMFAFPSAELDRLTGDISVQDVRIFRRAPMLRLDTMSVTDVAPMARMRRCSLQLVRPEAWSCAALADQGFHVTTHERRDTASYDILLTRAGKDELELIIISAVFHRWPGSRKHWYSAFQRFEVAYKSARRSHRTAGFECRECVEISCDRLTPNTRWTIIRLQCASGETRTLRLSLKWHELAIPLISIELTEPCRDDEVSGLAADWRSTQEADIHKYDELEQYLQIIWYRYAPPDSSPMAIPSLYADILHELAGRMKATGWAPELLLNAPSDVDEDHPLWQRWQKAVEVEVEKEQEGKPKEEQAEDMRRA